MREFIIRRDALEAVFGTLDARKFAQQQETLSNVSDAQVQVIADTQSLLDATYLTLSANTDLTSERVFSAGGGLSLTLGTGTAALALDNTVARASGGFDVTFTAAATRTVSITASGVMATTATAQTFTNKTLTAPAINGATIGSSTINGSTIDAPHLTGLTNAADDAAAATAGVAIGAVYHTSGALKVRIS